ncbi:MAG: hypothetical protein HY443_01740, partial [Candidatus Nealsonbacteria bacterium]|nr:hypothetical protein [Candidatus Nealsonbacteria bacterium]
FNMADKKIVDIRPPQPKGGEPEIEEKETVKPEPRFSFPKISPPSIRVPRVSKLFFLLPLLLTGGLVAYFTLGDARIEIWPQMNPLLLETKITVDKAVESPDAEQKVVPGASFEETKSVSGEFSASGKKTVESKAGGVIRVYNNSSVSQTLIQNTRFQPPLEKFEGSLQENEKPWFKSKSRITISPKSFQDVEVVADSPGEKYNIKPSKFSIPGLVGSAQYTLVYGESFQAFSGGEKKEFSQVLAKDLDSAKEELSQKSKTEGANALQAKMQSTGHLFLIDAVKAELLDDSSSVQSGEVSARFTSSVTAKSSILAPEYNDLDELVGSLLSVKLPTGKEMAESSLTTDYTLFSLDKNLSKMVLSVKSSVNTFSPLDEPSLKASLAGKSLEEAGKILEKQEGLEKIKIHLWPFWLQSIPKSVEKIKFEVNLTGLDS